MNDEYFQSNPQDAEEVDESLFRLLMELFRSEDVDETIDVIIENCIDFCVGGEIAMFLFYSDYNL